MDDDPAFPHAPFEVPVRDSQEPEIRQRDRTARSPRFSLDEAPLERRGQRTNLGRVLLDGHERERHGEEAEHVDP
jgi:hypothetical protein